MLMMREYVWLLKTMWLLKTIEQHPLTFQLDSNNKGGCSTRAHAMLGLQYYEQVV